MPGPKLETGVESREHRASRIRFMHIPRTPETTKGNSAVRRINIHAPAHVRSREVIREVEHKVRLFALGEREPLQTSPTSRSSFHLDVVIERLSEVSRIGILRGEESQSHTQSTLRYCMDRGVGLTSVLFFRYRSREASVTLQVLKPPGHIIGMISKFP